MRAVNLIPTDAPRRRIASRFAGVAGAAGDGPIGAYVVLAALAVAVMMTGAWALTSRELSSKQAELVRVEREAQAAEAKTTALAPYTAFAAVRNARVETVTQLLKGRFDWAHSLREVARVVPADVSLTSLVGTVSPTSQVEGGGGGGTLRSALPVPAVDLIGCAKSQTHVAKLLGRLRRIDGVQRVSLASSEKSDSSSASASECRSTDQMPQFKLTAFYAMPEGIVAAADAAAATTASGAAAGTNGAG